MARRKILPGSGGIPGLEKCYRKPGRLLPRRWTAQAAARAVCAALDAGVTQPEMQEALADCITCDSEDCQEERKQVEQLAEMALGLIQNNNQQLNALTLIGSVAELGLKILGRIARFIPGAGRAAAIPLEVARSSVAGVVGSVEARIAANNAQFAIINRIAANNAQFLIRSVGR